MKKVYSVKDIDELHRGGGLESIPSDAVITPSARDRLNELNVDLVKRAGGSISDSISINNAGLDASGIDQSVRANSSKTDLERLFNLSLIHI